MARLDGAGQSEDEERGQIEPGIAHQLAEAPAEPIEIPFEALGEHRPVRRFRIAPAIAAVGLRRNTSRPVWTKPRTSESPRPCPPSSAMLHPSGKLRHGLEIEGRDAAEPGDPARIAIQPGETHVDPRMISGSMWMSRWDGVSVIRAGVVRRSGFQMSKGA